MPNLKVHKVHVRKGAKIEGEYRYWLTRRFGTGPLLTWVMLNPSTADHTIDDPTIRQVMFFSRREGYQGCIVVNLFALRTPDRTQLRRHPEPIGPKNDAWLKKIAQKMVDTGRPIVVGWGASALPLRVHRVLKGPLKDAELICLGHTGSNYPRHPLYVSHDTEFIEYQGPGR